MVHPAVARARRPPAHARTRKHDYVRRRVEENVALVEPSGDAGHLHPPSEGNLLEGSFVDWFE